MLVFIVKLFVEESSLPLGPLGHCWQAVGSELPVPGATPLPPLKRPIWYSVLHTLVEVVWPDPLLSAGHGVGSCVWYVSSF